MRTYENRMFLLCQIVPVPLVTIEDMNIPIKTAYTQEKQPFRVRHSTGMIWYLWLVIFGWNEGKNRKKPFRILAAKCWKPAQVANKRYCTKPICTNLFWRFLLEVHFCPQHSKSTTCDFICKTSTSYSFGQKPSNYNCSSFLGSNANTRFKDAFLVIFELPYALFNVIHGPVVLLLWRSLPSSWKIKKEPKQKFRNATCGFEKKIKT